MCGIVGYIGDKKASDEVVRGLKTLEYRGYDSSGVAVIDNGVINLERAEGKIVNLDRKLEANPLKGSIGIGHTRWATHGRPSEENAHPHMEEGIAVVHNGIIENYLALKEDLQKDGAVFKSETDTEIITHLIVKYVREGSDLAESLRKTLGVVKGSYALAVISEKEADVIYCVRKECPLIIGLGDGENILSSDIPAVLPITNKILFLEDFEIARITKDAVEVRDLEGNIKEGNIKTVNLSPVMAEKGGYRHFMLKEIFEQPRAVIDTFRTVILEEEGDVYLDDFNIDLKNINKIFIVACGTSWHAGLVGKSLLEEFYRVPTEVDLASEFRYRDPLVDHKTLIIAITQSGETADTLAGVREAKKKGAKVLSICNVLESSITRESDFTLYTHAGPEIGVASTKAFTTQLTALFLIALYFGRQAGTMSKEKGIECIKELLKVPKYIEEAIKADSVIEEIAKKYFKSTGFLFLGRGLNFPIALEGALKLKEISYIHAEGYAAGEMKHGPIALVDENLPVIVLCPNDKHYKKVFSNLEEVKARDGKIIAVVTDKDSEAAKRADDVVVIPNVPHYLMPIVMTIPVQLIAYHIAVLKGTDVDQPRNLAKSVTVE